MKILLLHHVTACKEKNNIIMEKRRKIHVQIILWNQVCFIEIVGYYY